MYVSVRVIAGGKREAVEELANNRLKITVKEPAEHNLANRRVTELVALRMGVPKGKVRLISGAHTPAKLFSVEE